MSLFSQHQKSGLKCGFFPSKVVTFFITFLSQAGVFYHTAKIKSRNIRHRGQLRAAAEKPCLISRFVCVRACHRYRKNRVQKYIIPLGSSTDIYERKQGCHFACKLFLLSESNFTTRGNNAHRGAQAIIRMYHFRDI